MESEPVLASAAQGPRPRRAAVALIASGVVFLVAAGLLFWWRHGAAVFAAMIESAVAWCF